MDAKYPTSQLWTLCGGRDKEKNSPTFPLVYYFHTFSTEQICTTENRIKKHKGGPQWFYNLSFVRFELCSSNKRGNIHTHCSEFQKKTLVTDSFYIYHHKFEKLPTKNP